MKVLVLGATGPTGLEIVKQSVARGWTTRALVRTPSKMTVSHPLLEVSAGNVFDPPTLRQQAQGCDAVLCVLGAPAGLLGKGATTVYSDAARAIVAAVEGARVIFCTSAGVEHDDPAEVWFYRHVAKPLFLQRGYDDMAAAETVLCSSTLPRVVVRPGRLVNAPGGRKVRVSERYRPEGGVSVSRADLARFMLDQVQSDSWLGKTPTLTE
jgi:uncharacterized protein YbjT (DUF2867 family)